MIGETIVARSNGRQEAGDEPARVHHAPRRRGGDVAGSGAGAAPSRLRLYEKVPHSSRIRVKDITSLPPEVRAGIADVLIGKDGTVNIKLFDKPKALEMLVRTLVGVDVSVTNEVSVNLGDRIDAAMKRLTPEDQRVLANALDSLPESEDSHEGGNRLATDGAGSVGAASQPSAAHEVKIGELRDERW